MADDWIPVDQPKSDSQSDDWAPVGSKPVAMTSGQAEAQKDQDLLAKEAGVVPDALKAGLYSGANAAAFNVPSHVVAATTSLKEGSPYWETYKKQKEYEEALSRQHPTASMVGTGIGTVGSLAVPLGPVGKLATYGAKAATPVLGRLGGEAAGSALLGGTLSGASSLIEKQDPAAALRDAAIGGAGGAILGPAANAIASRLAGKAPVIDKATGSLSPEAVKAAEGVMGRPLTPEDIAALKPHLEAAGGEKGISAPAATEAILAEQGIGPSRSLATGQKAPEAAADVAASAREAAAQKLLENAQTLAGPRPPQSAVAQELHSDLTARQDATKAQYDLTFSHPGYFSNDIANNVMGNIQSSLAARQVPTNLNKLGLLPNQYGETAKAYQLVKDTLAAGVLPPGVQGPQFPPNMPLGPKLDMKNLEFIHKELNQLWSKASPTDRIGIDAIKDGYMNTLRDAVTNGMFYGNGKQVLSDMEKARALHADVMKTYLSGKAAEDKLLQQAIGKFKGSDGKITSNLDAAAAESAQAIINSKLINNSMGASLYNKLENTLGAGSPGMDAVTKYIRNYAFDTASATKPGGDIKQLSKKINEFLQPNNMAIASKVFSPEERAQMLRIARAAEIINKSQAPNDQKNGMLMNAFQRFAPGLISAASAIFHGPAGAFIGTVAGETATKGAQALGRSRAVKAEEFGAPVVRPERNVLAPVRNPSAMYPAEQDVTYENPRPLTINGPGNRMGRKSGGRVSDRLVLAAERAKKSINDGTKGLLGSHDTHVAQALEIANRNLEG
ncbi:hypothetical protein UFOVP231_43 [uncultured Caudovirales phage]|uniref:Uncharacterized protein n=1 Tax=uncultured Caudovirales phage TaxID=2100421 RepID=A0A6J7WQQ1_9CAUD|nr:hypothetical protein UFOVP231_43 [uncultured Caudovirales phage]